MADDTIGLAQEFGFEHIDGQDPPGMEGYFCTKDELVAFADALHTNRASSVAPGWRLVPEQPTQAMCDAARQSWVNDQGPKVSTLWGSEAADIYRAMLKAAPKSPVPGSQGER